MGNRTQQALLPSNRFRPHALVRFVQLVDPVSRLCQLNPLGPDRSAFSSVPCYASRYQVTTHHVESLSLASSIWAEHRTMPESSDGGVSSFESEERVVLRLDVTRYIFYRSDIFYRTDIISQLVRWRFTMSHFVECQTEFRDPQALVAALIECGFEESQIEVHDEATVLHGYHGDARAQKAHIVIRREHVGSGANDIGWERRPDGTFKAWISKFDAGVGSYNHRQESARFNKATQNRIKQEYAYQVIHRQQRALGRSIERQRLPSGEIEVVIAGYR